ncbi:FAD-dependent oxidoreductase [Candidatus Woesearchaeota archaeon]|jgi:thioredoxin reductase (NADPH)|nr:FAD-dependent oxidoreductase [Candidatus Woesearchaeota archaeon]MBT6519130.1 FAD-dependent oxidoreductase [Candidatus Woesearchaeota archaeon]MBT7367763.1 FAD-dependent oxidoreductase [Candidatus Woesearchaeota archaeon]
MTENSNNDKVYDILILGAGAAGMTCAIYAARYKMNVAIIGKEPGGLASTASDIQNWPGLIGSGIDIMQKFRAHVEKFEVPIIMDEIQEVVKEGELFKVMCGGGSYLGKSLLVALGTVRRKLDIPGEKEFEGRGVSHCATCDGFFYKDRTVAVVGGGDAAAMAAQMLSKIASKVYMIIRRDHLTTEPAREDDVENDPNIEIIRKSNLAKVNGEKMVTSIDLDTGKNIEVDGVFIEIGGIPLTNFAKSLGVDVSKRGRIVVNEKMQTNIAGVYSAGDISTGSAGFDQIVTAASEGAIAARSAFQYLKQNKKI